MREVLRRNRFLTFGLVGILILIAGWLTFPKDNKILKPEILEEGGGEQLYPLMILAMRQREYLGGEIKIEKDLGDQGGFKSYIISYPSDGLKLLALMNVPTGQKPANGWPVIILNHGYIAPSVYSTIDSYRAFSDYFARGGFLVVKSDYRGHGDSQGEAEGGHWSPAYTYDVLNLVASVKRMPEVNSEAIGMWGHSMGGNVTLRAVVVLDDIKASVIAAGVVGSAQDLFYRWRRRAGFVPPPWWATASARAKLVQVYGEPKDNSDFWSKISAISYVFDIEGPVQIHHGTDDQSVPKEFSDSLNQALIDAGKEVEYFVYEGADHNLSGEFRSLFLNRTLAFFEKNLK
ncbi:alpha/beta fold hydrolase [Candidatus Curtissbacteria bacterium]|nr:alpha/beta fold hydrolase [Candidatus Curtissbacteria bacterium]